MLLIKTKKCGKKCGKSVKIVKKWKTYRVMIICLFLDFCCFSLGCLTYKWARLTHIKWPRNLYSSLLALRIVILRRRNLLTWMICSTFRCQPSSSSPLWVRSERCSRSASNSSFRPRSLISLIYDPSTHVRRLMVNSARYCSHSKSSTWRPLCSMVNAAKFLF